MNINGKNILFVTPKYYGYENMISDALISMGAQVHMLYENLDELSFFYRFIYVYLPTHKKNVLDGYYRKKIKKYGKDIDIVFVIRGSSLSVDIIKYMKSVYPPYCRFIMYQWDGIKNNPNAIDIAGEFEKIYTFDVEDTREKGWVYRPLFYNEDKLRLSKSRSNDLLYICSLHSQRVEVLNKIKLIAEKSGFTLYSHLYSKKLIYYKRKYLAKKEEYVLANNEDVKFNTLSISDTYKLYGDTKVVVDFTHPGQTGFTMRTIECLGNKCKLITNNDFIKTADFYDPNNILVYSGTEIEIPDSFVKNAYCEMKQSLYDYYSLTGWIDTIFGE